ncbi:MAG: hypothetical protein LW817_05755 [Candidatus Caenarcaniphilales bacterium]|jgi:hypothetical protein|nr:hypothetical protein [Candidatus Caenarcaniphilales bacterium]
MKDFRALILFFLIVFSLSACAPFKKMLGLKETSLDFPPGEYIGEARLIGITDSPDAKPEAGADQAKAEEKKPEEKKVEEKKPEEKKPAEAKPAEGAKPGEESLAEAPAEEAKPAISMADILEVYKITDRNSKEVKLTFLPREEGLTDAIGVLTLDNDSQRFYWRSEGNNKDTWNIQLVKDNNVYSAIHSTFRFVGVVNAGEFENKVEGRLYVDKDTKVTEYFIKAYQHFNPILVMPKEAPAIKAGDPLELEVQKTGDDSSIIKAYAIGGEKKELMELEIQRIEKDKDAKFKIFIATAKELTKGDYNLFLVRSKRFKSNLLAFKIQ